MIRAAPGRILVEVGDYRHEGHQYRHNRDRQHDVLGNAGDLAARSELMVNLGRSDAGRHVLRQRVMSFGFLILPPRNASSGQARTRVSPSLGIDTGVKATAAGRKADAGLADVDRQARQDLDATLESKAHVRPIDTAARVR
jgi:hypothetical protein